MSLKSVSSLADLDKVQVCWKAWQDNPNSDFEHFQLICRLRSEVKAPYVIVAERNGDPCALLCARLEYSSFVPRIGYFSLPRLPAVILNVLYEGFLGDVDADVARSTFQYVWSLLASGMADAAVFNRLSEDSPLMHVLMDRAPQTWCEKRIAWTTHRSMTLMGDQGFLLKRLRSKHRSWIRRKQRELESAFPGEVIWRLLDRTADIYELCTRLELVASRTYQRGLGSGFIDDQEHRAQLSLFASRGQLRVQLLEIAGEIRAFWIGIVYGGVFYSWDTGYDPDLRDYEPGTLVFLRLTDGLVSEGVQKVDFGLGDALYKQRFGDNSWREATVRLFAPTPRGLFLRAVLAFSGLLDRTARRFLEKAGLFDRMKTGWRRRLIPAGRVSTEKSASR